MGGPVKKFKDWSCIKKGIFLCAVISIVNFLLIVGNKFITEEILDSILQQDQVHIQCEFDTE